MKPSYIPALKFNSLTFLYDPVVRFTTREKFFKNSLIKQASLSGNEKVLDIGCGTGTLLIQLKKKYPNTDVTGLDGDSKILSIAKSKTEYEELDIKYDFGMSSELPYKVESFDLVLSTLFFHHLSRENKILTFAEIFRVLKKNGKVHIADWGKPNNRIMRLLSYTIQIFDGFLTTTDNINGKLPHFMKEGGFCKIEETKKINTVYGTMCLYNGEKI